MSVSVLGVILTCVSSSVIGVWCGMELSFFGVIPLLVGSSPGEVESAFKYFMVQVVGSGFMLVSFISVYVEGFMWLVWFFFMVGMMMKIGVFPFHSWVPSVSGFLSGGGLFLVLGMQKIAPFYFLSGVGLPSCAFSVFLSFGLVSSLVGALGGLSQVMLRPLLGYSSLAHSGWLVALSLVDWVGFMLYFSVYILLLFLTIMVSSNRGFGYSLSVACYMLSLGGLPPFLGSFGKLVGMKYLISGSVVVVSVLIACSIISVGYYGWMFICLNLKGVEQRLDSSSYFNSGEHVVFNFMSGLILMMGIFMV
uniref:NADH-ubiquinone oxidoreductase chain 2 n=1 Tax=Fulvia mutica TaxID=80828 RepID=T2HGK1_FULMU|nr:NADH dehydrogenase subunit 2 [Fulvia mutica]BAN79047.1 NADH dehydrogenase subunit 2 [Fulvia mutica]